MKNYTEKDIRRFYSKVVVGLPDECWEWLGGSTKGRGTFNFDCHLIHAARFAFWIATGHWPGDLYVCHSCDNKMCVNPKHLWLGTHTDNAQDAAKKGHMTHKLTEAQVREIREKYATGRPTQSSLAKEYSVDQTCIGYIVRRKNWKHVK